MVLSVTCVVAVTFLKLYFILQHIEMTLQSGVNGIIVLYQYTHSLVFPEVSWREGYSHSSPPKSATVYIYNTTNLIIPDHSIPGYQILLLFLQ